MKNKTDSFPSSDQYRTLFQTDQTIMISPDICAQVDLSGERQGAFSMVFPCQIQGNKYAIRCWKCIPVDMYERIVKRLSIISKFVFGNAQRYFIHFELNRKGLKSENGPIPFLLMDWIDDPDIKTYIRLHLREGDRLKQLADDFKEMALVLHQAGISHNDLQPGNIRVKENGNLYLIDYDTLFLPCMSKEMDELKGALEFQHPMRNHNLFLSQSLDRYALIVIYASIIGIARQPSLFGGIIPSEGKELLFGPSMTGDARIHLLRDPVMRPFVEYIESLSDIRSMDEILPLNELLNSVS